MKSTSALKLSAIALMLFSAAAMATPPAVVTTSLENGGRIQSTTSTYAAVNGNGTSNSVLQANASSYAGGQIQALDIAGGKQLGIVGNTATTGNVLGFNVSTGNGVGSAVGNVWSDAIVTGTATFTNHNGNLNISGTADNGFNDPVRNGVDANVNASTGRDGYVDTATNASFAIGGSTSQLPVAGGAQVAGNVWSTQSEQSTVEVGGVTFAGGTPAGQAAATRFGNAGTQVFTAGSFYDPTH